MLAAVPTPAAEAKPAAAPAAAAKPAKKVAKPAAKPAAKKATKPKMAKKPAAAKKPKTATKPKTIKKAGAPKPKKVRIFHLSHLRGTAYDAGTSTCTGILTAQYATASLHGLWRLCSSGCTHAHAFLRMTQGNERLSCECHLHESPCAMQAAAPKKKAAPKAKKTITKKVRQCISWTPALCARALLWLL